MQKIPTELNGVFILEPKVFGDARGFFLESYNERAMSDLDIRAHSYRTTIPIRHAMCCAGCTIRLSILKGN